MQDLAVPIAAVRIGPDYAGWFEPGGLLYTTAALAEAERGRICEDHASLAKALGDAWHFPPRWVEAIGRHHQVPPTTCGSEDQAACLWQLGHWVGTLRFDTEDLFDHNKPAESEVMPLPPLQLAGIEQEPAKLKLAYVATFEAFHMLHPIFAQKLPAGVHADTLKQRATTLHLSWPTPDNRSDGPMNDHGSPSNGAGTSRLVFSA